MPTDPYDDLFRNLTKAIEDLFSNLSQEEPARIIGCTIISGTADSSVFEDEKGSDDDEFDYELIDGPEAIYITAEIPSLSSNQPVVKIMPGTVQISFDENEIEIELPAEVQTDESHTVIQNGIMDIVCRKVLGNNYSEE